MWRNWMAARIGLLLAWLTVSVAVGLPLEALALQDAGKSPLVVLSELPAQGQQTYRLILSGGPFPYEKDGVVFSNREKLLPKYPKGFYREYTVPTPGLRSRGARRIVCGGRVPTRPVACYYTDDHYASFRRIGAVPVNRPVGQAD